jgi:hypothetical protein
MGIFLGKEIRLFIPEKVIIDFTEQLFLEISHKLLAGLVESYKTESFGILYEDHVVDVLHDLSEKSFIPAQITPGR